MFDHQVLKPSSPLFRGFDDRFYAPHSRHTEVLEEDIRKIPSLEVLAVSEEVGVFAVKTENSRQFFLLGHLEYDRDTLAQEYQRDVDRGLTIQVPRLYFHWLPTHHKYSELPPCGHSYLSIEIGRASV